MTPCTATIKHHQQVLALTTARYLDGYMFSRDICLDCHVLSGQQRGLKFSLPSAVRMPSLSNFLMTTGCAYLLSLPGFWALPTHCCCRPMPLFAYSICCALKSGVLSIRGSAVPPGAVPYEQSCQLLGKSWQRPGAPFVALVIQE